MVLSLVYVKPAAAGGGEQSYDTNVLVARQIRYALQLALENGLKDQKVDPNDKAHCADLAARRCATTRRCRRW
jgi:hypothetical protein